jgi:hypothetical protein
VADLTPAASLRPHRRRTAAGLFSPEVQRVHRAFRVPLLTYLRAARPLPLLTIPVIYSTAVPLVLLDLWITAYQWICFPVYGIARVCRADYVAFDRPRLAYLNAIEKFHCAFCSYGNGVLAYALEIAGRTEQFWCPIKHGAEVHASHHRQAQFVEYGDAAGYRRALPDLRRSLVQDVPPPR